MIKAGGLATPSSGNNTPTLGGNNTPRLGGNTSTENNKPTLGGNISNQNQNNDLLIFGILGFCCLIFVLFLVLFLSMKKKKKINI
jgi:hypothetical protein